MRQSITLLAAIIAVVLSSTAMAQSVSNAPSSQKLVLATGFDSRAANSTDVSLSKIQVNSITRSAIKSSTIDALSNLTSTATNLVSSKIAEISTNNATSFTVALGTDRSLLSEQKLNVSISFDAQQLGGILTVKVELVPVFSGIGVSNRPFASKSYVAAVDQMNQDEVKSIVSKLTTEIASEFNLASH